MRVECAIRDSRVDIPGCWLNKWKEVTGKEPDTVVFDLSDASPNVPAAVFLIAKEAR